MGAICARPPLEDEEVFYFGPADRPRNVPLDLRLWKQALAERSRQAESVQTNKGGSETLKQEEHVSKGSLPKAHLERKEDSQPANPAEAETPSSSLAVI